MGCCFAQPMVKDQKHSTAVLGCCSSETHILHSKLCKQYEFLEAAKSLGILFGRYQNIHEDHRTNPCFHGEGELPTSFWCSCDGQSSHWCGACYFSGAWGAVFAGRHDLQQCLCQLGALVVHPTVQHTPQRFNININMYTYLFSHLE